MRTHALVVESRKEIIEELEDRLLSINHSCEIATSQVQARQCLQRQGREYSYVILSLDVPVRPDRPPKMKFGFNLFQEIQERFSNSRIPIVITLNSRNINSSIAVRILHDGAFVAVKPFEDDIELSLESAIFKALESKGRPAKNHESESAVVIDRFDNEIFRDNTESEFTKPELAEQDANLGKPEMTFYENCVELCGVAVCGDSGTLTRRLLDLLKERTSEGKYRAYSGYELAVITDCESGQQGIGAIISKFRNKAFSLLDGKNAYDLGDIIINDRAHGYRLEENIEVIEILSSETKDNMPKDDFSDLSETQQNILKYLQANRKGSSLELQQNLQISKSVVNRNLQELREAGYAICSGKGKLTLWLPVDQ